MKEDNLMEEHEYWVNKYREHFKKIYPLMEFRGSSYKENIKRIKKAIKENEPVENNYSDGILY